MIIPQQDGVIGGVFPQDIDMLPGADAQTLALAGGVAGQALVTAQHMAVPVYKVAGGQVYAAIFPEKMHIIPVGDEADVLTVGLVGIEQTRLTGTVSYSGLVVLPYGQQQVGKLVLRELVEDIALVLVPVTAPEEAVFCVAASKSTRA